MDVGAAEASGSDQKVDAEQLRRARAFDPVVWGEWHDQYYPFVHRYALTRVMNTSDAEDVASQVFLEAMKSIHRFEAQGRPLLAWLYGIARNLISHKLRQRGRTTSLDILEQAGQPANSDEAFINNLELKIALAKLKPAYQEVLTLRYLLDLPNKQVAGLIGKSEAATYSLQVRALESLRCQLSDRESNLGQRTLRAVGQEVARHG